jgi:hypothetical protein
MTAPGAITRRSAKTSPPMWAPFCIVSKPSKTTTFPPTSPVIVKGR